MESSKEPLKEPLFETDKPLLVWSQAQIITNTNFSGNSYTGTYKGVMVAEILSNSLAQAETFIVYMPFMSFTPQRIKVNANLEKTKLIVDQQFRPLYELIKIIAQEKTDNGMLAGITPAT